MNTGVQVELSSFLTQWRDVLPQAARLVLGMLDRIEGGSLHLHLPSGVSVLCGRGALQANVYISDWSVFSSIICKGTIGLGEAWMDGLLRTDHLADFLTLMAANREAMKKAIHGNVLQLLGHRLWHKLRPNSLTGSRKNIEAHYDLGNDFYALWLDETMTYSSAFFTPDTPDLAAAQREKYRRILRRLNLQPNQTILEVGCGWGGFAEVACTEFGARVHALTLSPSQLAWAKERALRSGFSDRVIFELRDYRDMQGQFDHVVSIEMIEAVGEEYWPTYFKKLHDCVRPGGQVVIQGISIADDLFNHYRRDVDFIQRYIFPGGMLFSPRILGEQAQKAGLRVVSDEPFGLDYARTLRLWTERFESVRDAVLAQGFDERFMRMWHFYLAYCEAGFRAASTNVHHFALVRA